MKKSYLLAGLAAMMLAACSDNENDLGVTPSGSGSENVSGMLTLLGDQSDRIETATPLRDGEGLSKWKRLHYVGSIKPTTYEDDYNWSATAVTIDGDYLYITWHSNRQAGKKTNPIGEKATKWGGAIDMVKIADAENGDFEKARIVSAVSDTLKFNNVLVKGDSLYLSATSAEVGGAVAVVAANLDNKTGKGEHVNVAVTEFPGASVNAVAVDKDNKIVAVSGHDEGAYGVLGEVSDVIDGFVGGKYIVCEEDNTYVLYDVPSDERGARIKINGEDKFNLGIHLKSKATVAETYSLSGGWQEVTDAKEADYYGKHVMAIAGDFAYVGTGTCLTGDGDDKVQENGLRVYNLTDGTCVASTGTGTTGVYVDKNYVYAATLAGLRIYKRYEKGSVAVQAKKELELLAFETKDYEKGDAKGNVAASLGTNDDETVQRHSANFVTAHEAADGKNVYVYVAYGQSGVNVYKFAQEDMMNLNSKGNEDLTTQK